MQKGTRQIELARFQKLDADELKDSARGNPASGMNYNYDAREVVLIQREIRLRDGLSLQLRHLRRGDRERLKTFFAHCSQEAIRFRFMSSIKRPSDSLLNYLADADGSQHVALIVTQRLADDERIVGEGRYVLFNERPRAADIALLVVDELRRRGMATLLIHHLMEIACRKGVTCFSADVLDDNRAMLSLLRKIGQPLSATVSSGVNHFEIPFSCIEKNRSSEAA